MPALTHWHAGAHALLRVVREDGGVRHVRITAEPLLDASALTGLAGVYQEVSAQRRTELAPTASFDRLSAAHARAAPRIRVVRQLQGRSSPRHPRWRPRQGWRSRPATDRGPGVPGGRGLAQRPAAARGRGLVTAGDIAGHGIDAATGMVALRNALRGLAFAGRTPGRG
ncbi:serine/threonine-protein phosphatase [Streptomyces sp. NBC_00435]|uniref:SpoIIE family protein phosphatase n=1 Tax=Streptomyces sp. NBC_00435 TaxID=2903649 RepID=UPI002E21E5D6